MANEQKQPKQPDQEQSKQEQLSQGQQKVVVNAQTFFALQMAQLDNNIADSELHEAEAALEVARAKKVKTQSILDFNIDQIEQQQRQQPVQNPSTQQLQDDNSKKLKSKIR